MFDAYDSLIPPIQSKTEMSHAIIAFAQRHPNLGWCYCGLPYQENLRSFGSTAKRTPLLHFSGVSRLGLGHNCLDFAYSDAVGILLSLLSGLFCLRCGVYRLLWVRPVCVIAFAFVLVLNK